MKELKLYEKVREATKNLKLSHSKGTIIFLNGTTSSGKTTIAKKLQEELPEIFYYLPIDLIMLEMLPKRVFSDEKEILKQASCVLNGYFKMVDAYVMCGNNVIIDCVLQESNWLKLALEILKKHKILFIGIKSSLRDLQKREQKRGDRVEGQAHYQFYKIHRFCIYDVEVDTSKLSVAEAVRKIKKYYESHKKPDGFIKTYQRILKKEKAR